MSRKKRMIVSVLVGTAVLVLGALLLVPSLVDVNAYRETIETAASEALGSPVHLGTMSLSVFPRIALSIDSPTLGDGAGGDPGDGGRELLKVRRLEVGARLIPLLRGRLEVTGITLHEPEIVLRRHPDGTWNIAGLLGGSDHSQEDAQAAPPTSLPVEVESLSIRGARVVMVDAGWPAATGEFVVGASADVRISGDLLGEASVAGTLALRADLPLPPGTGHDATLPADINVAFTVTIGGGGQRLALDPFDVDINGSVLHFRATLEPAASPILTSLTLEPSHLETGLLAQALAATGSAPPLSFSSPQPVELAGRLGGADAEALLTGLEAQLTVHDFTFQHASMAQPMENVQGTVELRGESVAVREFSGTLGHSQIGGDLTIEGLEAPRVSFDLHSTQADFWELFSFASAASPPVPEGGAGNADLAAPPSALDRLEATGKIRIESGSFHTLDFTALEAGLTFGGQIIRLAPFRMSLHGGTFEGTARLDMQSATPAFRIESRLDGVNAGTLLADNLDLGDTLDGTISTDLTVEGAGLDIDAIVRSLSGGGSLEVKEGRLGRLEVLKPLSQAGGIFGEQSLAGLSGQLETEGTAFTVMRGDLKLNGPTATARALRLETPDMVMEGEAVVDLLAAELEAQVAIVFSDELSGAMRAEKSRAASVFWNADLGRVHLPLTLSGPVDAPAPGIDWGQATQQLARRKVKEGLRGRLSGLIGNDSAAALVGERAPAAAEQPSSGAPAATDTGAVASETIKVAAITAHWSRSFLKPDLKLSGRISGRDIATAELRVTDANGRNVTTIAPLPEVQQYVAGGPPPGDITDIAWAAKVKGSKLLLAKFPVVVEVVVTDRAGARVEKQQAVDR